MYIFCIYNSLEPTSWKVVSFPFSLGLVRSLPSLEFFFLGHPRGPCSGPRGPPHNAVRILMSTAVTRPKWLRDVHKSFTATPTGWGWRSPNDERLKDPWDRSEMLWTTQSAFNSLKSAGFRHLLNSNSSQHSAYYFPSPERVLAQSAN